MCGSSKHPCMYPTKDEIENSQDIWGQRKNKIKLQALCGRKLEIPEWWGSPFSDFLHVGVWNQTKYLVGNPSLQS